MDNGIGGQEAPRSPIEAGGRANSSEPADETLPRLDELIDWYEREALRADIGHKATRIASIVAAAAIPVLAAASVSPVAGAILGGTVVALEAIQELFQFQRNWVAFGTTKEALKRERSLYRAVAGPYRRSRTEDPGRLLAERVEALVAVETAGWADIQLSDRKST